MEEEVVVLILFVGIAPPPSSPFLFIMFKFVLLASYASSFELYYFTYSALLPPFTYTLYKYVGGAIESSSRLSIMVSVVISSVFAFKLTLL